MHLLEENSHGKGQGAVECTPSRLVAIENFEVGDGCFQCGHGDLSSNHVVADVR